ncbi:MAG: hypothetical protein H6729_12915 [Deltaproteobacteria bacterium]|nr:hypothetical protein [Deltaproteobacteria bacterium]
MCIRLRSLTSAAVFAFAATSGLGPALALTLASTWAVVAPRRAEAAPFVDGKASPYTDTRGRFSLEMPSGWQLHPAFGDTKGMVFRKTLGQEAEAFAAFRVQVELKKEASLDDIWIDVETHLAEGARGVEVVSRNRRLLVAGRPARGRRYRVRSSGHGASASGENRDVRVDVFETTEAFFVLSYDARMRDAARLSADRRAFLRRFRVGPLLSSSPSTAPDRDHDHDPDRDGSGAGSGADGPSSSGSSARAALTRDMLLGAWRHPSGSVLSLGPDGRFSLGRVEGTFSFSGGELVLKMAPGNVQTFRARIEDRRLILTSPALSEPVSYVRSEVPSTPGRTTLVGRWMTETPNGAVHLVLSDDGHFSLAETKGTWRVESATIRFEKSPTESILYAFELAAGRLTLSGGDLDEPVVFTRTP